MMYQNVLQLLIPCELNQFVFLFIFFSRKNLVAADHLKNPTERSFARFLPITQVGLYVSTASMPSLAADSRNHPVPTAIGRTHCPLL